MLWECITLLDEATAEEVERRGGLAAIAISHPHYYSAMVEWAHRFDCPVLLHARRRASGSCAPTRRSSCGRARRATLGGLTLVRCGGHFAGGTVLWWPDGADGAGALLAGDIVQVDPRPLARGRSCTAIRT